MGKNDGDVRMSVKLKGIVKRRWMREEEGRKKKNVSFVKNIKAEEISRNLVTPHKDATMLALMIITFPQGK